MAAESILHSRLRFLRQRRLNLDWTEVASRPVALSLTGLLFGSGLFLRCPATLLHAEFWAEDGVVWYADAYNAGWHSLFFLLNGYLQTISRLVALLAQFLPLAWAPTLFAVAALLVQTLTAVFIVSARMATVWPST